MKTRWLKFTIGAGITAITAFAVILFFAGRAFAPSGQTATWTSWNDFYNNAGQTSQTTKTNVVLSAVTHDVQLNLATTVGWGTPRDVMNLASTEYYPVVAARDGKVYVAAQSNVDAYGNPYYNYSYDNGVTWPAAGSRMHDTSGVVYDTEFAMAMGSDGVPQLVWITSSTNAVKYTKLSGTTWLKANGTAGYDQIANTSAVGSSPQIALDSNNRPHIIWKDTTTGSGDVYYTKWDGSAWVTANGTAGYDVIATTIGPSNNPQIALDSTNKPHVVWFDSSSGNWDVYYSKWSGTAWTQANDITAGYDLLDTAVISEAYPQIVIDTTIDKPHVVWVSGTDDIAYGQWNGSAWVQADGTTAGKQIIATIAGASRNPKIALDSTQKPHVAWQDAATGSDDIYYNKWTGTAWTKADGTGNYDNVSNNATVSRYPKLLLDNTDNPRLMWMDSISGLRACYSGWSGSAWVKASGTSGYDDIGDIVNVWDAYSPTSLVFTKDTPKAILSAAWRDNAAGTKYGNLYASTYAYPGVIGGTGASVGLRVDAGSGFKAKWDSLSWTAGVPANTAIKFRIRTAVQPQDLASATWYGPNGAANMDDWSSNYFGTSNIAGDTNPTGNSMHSSMPAGRYADIMVKLDSSDGSATPTLSDATLTYHTFNKPQGADLAQLTTADVPIAEGGFTTGGNIKLRVSNISDTAVFTNPKAEFEIKPVTVAFDGTTTLYQGSVVAAGVSEATVSGLSDNSYYWRARLISSDTGAPCSDWTSFGANSDTPTAGTDFISDLAPPAAPSGATISAGTGWNANYITPANQTTVQVSGNKSSDTLKIKIEIDDEDTFTDPKTRTLTSLGTETTYADPVGINVTTATALSDGTIAIRITAYDIADNTSVQTVLKGVGTFKKDTVYPLAPSGVTIAAGTGWNANYISNTNKAAVKASGTKPSDVDKIKIEIDDEDTFTNNKQRTLTGVGTGTTYADTTGIDVTTPTALSDGNIAIRITGYDAAGNVSPSDTVLTGAAIFKKDISVPSGGSISYPDQVQSATSASVSFTDGTDSGTGIETKSLDRQEASFTSNTVGSYSAFSQIAPNPASPYTDNGLVAAKSYKYRYVVTDYAGNAATYTSTNQVKVHGAPATMLFTTQPSSPATAGINFITQPALTLRDANSNTCTSATNEVSLSAVLASDGTTPGTGTLNGTTNLTPTNGVVTFSGLNYTKAESIKLKATASGLTAVNSNTIVVNVGAAAKLAFIVQPGSPATAGVAFTQQPQVAVTDSGDNIITSDNLTKIALSRGSNGTDVLQGSNLIVRVTNGVATFSGLSYNKAETMNILASDSSHGVTHTTDTDFNAGTKTDTAVSGTGSAGKVVLTTSSSTTFGGNVESTINFYQPYHAVVDVVNNKVYVVDTVNSRVCRFDSGSGGTTYGANWQTFGSSGAGANQFTYPYGIFVDTANNKVYVVDTGNSRVCRFDSGSGGTTYGANWQTFGTSGTGTSQFNSPNGIFVDSANNKVYVVDTSNARIVRMDSGAGGTTLGQNWQTYGSSGAGAAQFNGPYSIFVDSTTNKAYVADGSNHRVARFDSGGGGTTLGANRENFGTNGAGISQFNIPRSISVDTVNNKVVVADYNNHRICRFDSGGGGTTLGQNWQTFGTYGSGVNQFNYPRGIHLDVTNDKVFVVDWNNSRVVRMDSGGGATTLGGNWQTYGTSGTGANQFNSPQGIFVDSINNKAYAADTGNNRICRFDSGGGGTTLGANWSRVGYYGSDDYLLYYPRGLFVDTIRNKVYVTDSINARIARFDSGAGGTTFGNNRQTFGSSGAGANQFTYPYGIFVDTANNKAYVVDTNNNRICRFDSGGGGTTLGANWQTFGTSGTGTSQFNSPNGIFVDSANNKVYVVDTSNARIVRMDSGAGGTTLGQNWQTYGSSGAGAAQFNGPRGIFVDTIRNKVYVADSINARIARFDSGAGGTTFGANWETASGGFGSVYGVCAEEFFNKVYIADTGSNRIRRIDSGFGGTTFGANLQTLGGSSGQALDRFSGPYRVCVDNNTNKLYVADSGNHRLLKFDSGSAVAYTTPGTFTSATMDLGASKDLNRLEWNPLSTSQPANTTLTVQVAANNDNATWNYVDLQNVAAGSGDIPASLDNTRYIRYRATLATTDTRLSPSLEDMTLEYDPGALILTSATSTDVAVGPAGVNSYVITNTSPQTAGQGWSEVVTAKDAFGNTVTTDSATVVTMTDSGSAQFYTDANYNVLQPNSEYTLTNGQVTVYVKDNTAETITLTATSTGGKTGDSGSILVNPAGTTAYFLNAPDDITAGGAPAQYSVTRKDQFNNLATIGTETVDLTSSSTGANKKFSATPGGPAVTTIDITDGSSSAAFYYYDELAGTFDITASGNGATPATDSIMVVAEATTVSYSLSAPVDIVAGTTLAQYTVTRKDTFGNNVTTGTETVTLTSTQTAGVSRTTQQQEFRATAGGQATTTVDILNGSSSADFYYYEELMGTFTITASKTDVTEATDSINVAHGVPDHLRFSSGIATPQKAGAPFILPVIEAVDGFGNILNSDYSATPYSGAKTITYTLSGVPDSPSGGYNDEWTTAVNFADGVSTAALNTTLYRAQDTTVTASSKAGQGGDLPNSPITPDVVSNVVTVDPEIAYTVKFTQQPSSPTIINVALTQQPIVRIEDFYGNKTHDASAVTLYDSTSESANINGPGALSATANPLNAIDGVATFSAVRYNYPATIYLYAEVAGIAGAYSNAVDFTVAPSSMVEAADVPVTNFNLVPTNDSEAEKFPVLKFKVTDTGGDLISILIDKMVVRVGSTIFGANPQAFGSFGSGANQFSTPYGVSVDSAANKVYVADTNNNRIARFDSGAGGTTLGANWQVFGTQGSGASQFDSPASVSTDPAVNKVYVVDRVNGRICRFDSGAGGTTLGANWESFGTQGTGAGQFSFPYGVFVDPANNKVYVADTSNHRIVRFDSGAGGTTLGANWESFGTEGTGADQFSSPDGIFVDSTNNKVYVGDNYRVCRFDSGAGGTTLGANWQVFGTQGSGAQQFGNYIGLFVDTAANKIYAADNANNRICKFNSGSGTTTFGQGWQTFATGISYPHAVFVVSANNKVYVPNSGSHNIARFDSGGGGFASTDIAWVELTDGVTAITELTGDYITDSALIFGTGPNGDSTAGLATVPDGGTVEYTVNIHMKPGKLTAVDGAPYIFSIDETGVFADTGLSSQLGPASGQVAPVTGTITVNTSHLELVTTADENSVSMNAGQPANIKIQAVDANKNIDRNYIGNHTFRFYGLNSIGGYNPQGYGVNFGLNTPLIGFTNGVSANGTLVAYMKEIGNVTVAEVGQSYQTFGLTADVAAGSASLLSTSSGNNQSGAINGPLGLPLAVLVSDTYGNAAQGTSVDFATGTYPGGAAGYSVNPASAVSGIDGLASTVFTLGDIAGTYTATATSGSLTGSPRTFSATALAPTAMNIVSGNNQTGRKVTETIAPFVVQVMAGGTPVPNVTVNFALINPPSGASGQALSDTSAVTASNGQASTTLTLGDKTGLYTVRATYSSFTQDFTVNAGPEVPYKVVLTGPSSVKAGEVSTSFALSIQDQFNNSSPVTADTIFNLTNAPSVSGTFTSDAGGNNPIPGNAITLASGNSTTNFFYKDPATGSLSIAADYVSGQAGLVVTSASLPFTVIPADIDHFTVTGTATPMDAGGTRTITIRAYDTEGNIKTDYTGPISVVFSGANPSPVPSNQAATVDDVAFGSGTLLTFNAGQATGVLKLYKAENTSIIATAGGTTTPVGSRLDITVRHLAVDHLKFGADLPSPQTAGTAFDFETTIDAVDLYDNICDGANGAPVYNNASKTITYTLSGASNAPETGELDVFTNPVAFVSGRTTTALSATLYRGQSTTITPSTVGIDGANVASNVIAVSPRAVDHMRFSVQPSTAGTTSQPLVPQPIVAVADQFGNPVTSAVAQITLAASTTSGTFTPVTNGILSAAALTKNITNGEAAFSNLTYSYPENIYLRASAVSGYSLPDIYSFQVAFATAQDTTITKIAQTGTISSLATTAAAAGPVLGFRVTDGGTDGYATKIKQIAIRNTNGTATAAWTDFIAGASLSDGTSEIQAYSIANNKITFGSGSSVLYNIVEGTQKTYTLKLVLKAPLPDGADNESLEFILDVTANDIALDTVSSTFSAAAQAITDAAVIDVDATNFRITSGTTMLTAGSSAEVSLKAVDVNLNADEDYTGDHSLVFSGATMSPKNDKATVTVANTVEFSDTYGAGAPVIVVPFAAGVNSSAVSITPYKAEVALIKAYEPSGPYGAAIGTATTTALQWVVNGGSAYQLFWMAEPVAVAAANAPWNEFVISVTDEYGNTAPSTVDVTVNLSGGSLGANCTQTVAAINGEAHFTNFTATAATYPAAVFVTGTAPGISVDTGQFGPIVLEEKYSVTLNIKDSVTNTALPEIQLQVLQGSTVVYAPARGNSPFTFELPYGDYTLSLDKEKYVQYNKDVTAGVGADAADGVVDNSITLTLYMTSIEEATADYQVRNSFVYDESLDKLTARLWLERRGKLVLNAVDNTLNKLGDATIQVFDEVTNDYMATLTIPHPAFTDYTSAVYKLEALDVTEPGGTIQLEPGKTYFARCTISYGGTDGTGKLYETGATFTITVTQSLVSLSKQIADVTGQIADITTAVGLEVAGVKGTVADEAKTTREKVAEVKGETGKILTATETTIPEKITSETTTIKTQLTTIEKSEILNTESSIMLGTTLVIRYRTYANANPVITVYDPNNVVRVASMPMAEVSPGLYEYPVTFAQGWPRGQYSIVCSETSYGTLDAITMNAISTDIEDISSNVAAVLGSVAPVRDIKSTIDAFSAAFDVVEANIKKAAEALAGVRAGTEEATAAAENVTSLFSTLKEMSVKIHEIGGTLGYDLEKLYEVSETRSKDIGYIRNKTQELKALMLLNQQLIESAAKEEPVVQTWFEFR